MFRALVVSDTHGDLASFEKIIRENDGIPVIFHLGDVSRDAKIMAGKFLGKEFYFVKGNNEFTSDAPEELFLRREGVNLFLTHGHRYGVKRGLSLIVSEGAKKGAQAVLFGHTHSAHLENQGGILLFNPGSVVLSFGGKHLYGILTIENGAPEARLCEIGKGET